jgi:hypothetical protein
LEKLNINKNNNTVILIDIVDFYPSTRFSLIYKAIEYFTENLSLDDKNLIFYCMDLIKFGMKSTLISFKDKIFEYKGNGDEEDRGLAIGGYESAFLADMVVSFLFEKTIDMFDNTIYKGIYRDDGITIFNNKLSEIQLDNWISLFQRKINFITEGNFFKFTVALWDEGNTNATINNNNVDVITKNSFPFLDMDLFWINNILNFKVYKKDGQMLKYVEKGSAHTSATYASIAKGVFKRLARLTSNTTQNNNCRMDVLYPEHCRILLNAKLINIHKIPTLNEVILNDNNIDDPLNKKKEKILKFGRNLNFQIKVSKFWKTPIHVIIKKLKIKHNLKWLRFKMCYKRHCNLAEKFNGILNNKLNKDLISLDFENNTCNCSKKALVNGKCAYDDKCRSKCIIYQANCKICNSNYIGNTQRNFKARMDGHYNDIRNLINKDKKSDSFANHFAKHFSTAPKPQEIREILNMKILWQGNPISLMKSFGSSSCKLCMKERLLILDAIKNRKKKKKIINSNSEIYGACRHKSKFHRFTSEFCEENDLRRSGTISTTSTCSTFSFNSTSPTSSIYSTHGSSQNDLNTLSFLQDEIKYQGTPFGTDDRNMLRERMQLVVRDRNMKNLIFCEKIF